MVFFAIYILPSAFFGLFHTQQRFAKCPIKNNWQRALCRMIGCRVGFAVCGTQQNLCTWQRCTANYWNHVVGAKAVPWHRGWHGGINISSSRAVQLCTSEGRKCIEFISGGSSTNLDAILATEGYRHLEVSSPSVFIELLKAAHRNKRRRSPGDS